MSKRRKEITKAITTAGKRLTRRPPMNDRTEAKQVGHKGNTRGKRKMGEM